MVKMVAIAAIVAMVILVLKSFALAIKMRHEQAEAAKEDLHLTEPND